jgi:hypothetical protein
MSVQLITRIWWKFMRFAYFGVRVFLSLACASSRWKWFTSESGLHSLNQWKSSFLNFLSSSHCARYKSVFEDNIFLPHFYQIANLSSAKFYHLIIIFSQNLTSSRHFTSSNSDFFHRDLISFIQQYLFQLSIVLNCRLLARCLKIFHTAFDGFKSGDCEKWDNVSIQLTALKRTTTLSFNRVSWLLSFSSCKMSFLLWKTRASWINSTYTDNNRFV